MNWKTKYIQEKVSEKEEVIEVFGDGLFDLIDELNIDVDIEVNTSRLPYIKQDITSFTLNEKHVIELNVQKSTHMFETRIEVNLIKLAHDSDSIQQVTNVCSIVNNSGHYHIELDHDETYLYNQHTVELIYKKIVEKYMFVDALLDSLTKARKSVLQVDVSDVLFR